MRVIIRPAQVADEPALLPLVQRFATSFAVEAQAFAVSFQELLHTSHAHLGVAVLDDRLIGYLLGFEHLTFYANGRVAWVEEVMVQDEHRRLGVGRLLMGDFEAWALARHAQVVALATRRAAAFYTALGYEASATYFRRVIDANERSD